MKLIKLSKTWVVALALPLAGALAAHAAPQGTEPEVDIQTQQLKDRPTPDVDKQLAGWQEAGPDGVGTTLRANWVMLNATDGIDGQIVGVSEPVDVFLLRNGFVVGRTTTVGGQFRMESATPGPYTIVGYSPEAIFTYSFNAISNDGSASGMPASIQTTPILGKANNRLVAKLLREHSPEVDFREYGDYDIGEAEGDPAQHYGWSGLENLSDAAVPATGIQSQAVSLVNGRFYGRVHQMHNQNGRPVEVLNTRVILIQEGELIAEVQVNNSGVFEFDNVVAGSYGLVAVGADGFAALGFDLVETAATATDRSETGELRDSYNPLFRKISYAQDVNSGGAFDITLGSPESIGWINSYVSEQTYLNALNEPLPEMAGFDQMPYDYFNPNGAPNGGGFGGGGGGGGGGFGGFGGGLLLPLGAAAIIIDAIDDDDDNFNGGVRLISPFNP